MNILPHPLNRLRWTPSHPLYEFDPLQVTPYRRVVGSYVETLAVSVIYTDGDAEMLTPDTPVHKQLRTDPYCIELHYKAGTVIDERCQYYERPRPKLVTLPTQP